MAECLLCSEAVDVEGDADLCSACGFMADRAQVVGLALVPAGQRGECGGCIHAVVCRVFAEADAVGAVVAACPVWTKDPEDQADEVLEDAGDVVAELLARCERECPAHDEPGAHPKCRPQTYGQRVAFCPVLRGWGAETSEE